VVEACECGNEVSYSIIPRLVEIPLATRGLLCSMRLVGYLGNQLTPDSPKLSGKDGLTRESSLSAIQPLQ